MWLEKCYYQHYYTFDEYSKYRKSQSYDRTKQDWTEPDSKLTLMDCNFIHQPIVKISGSNNNSTRLNQIG